MVGGAPGRRAHQVLVALVAAHDGQRRVVGHVPQGSNEHIEHWHGEGPRATLVPAQQSIPRRDPPVCAGADKCRKEGQRPRWLQAHEVAAALDGVVRFQLRQDVGAVLDLLLIGQPCVPCTPICRLQWRLTARQLATWGERRGAHQ